MYQNYPLALTYKDRTINYCSTCKMQIGSGMPLYASVFLPSVIQCSFVCMCVYIYYVYGSEFWTMYNWPFSDLEHFYYTWFAPSYSETISFGVVVKSTNRAFRKHILYIPLLIFVHHTGLQMQKNDKKWCFYTFSFFRNRPVNFQATLLILSNYSVNVVCLGPVS